MLRGCETPSRLPLASAPGAGLCTLDKAIWIETWAKVQEVSCIQHPEAAPAPGWGHRAGSDHVLPVSLPFPGDRDATKLQCCSAASRIWLGGKSLALLVPDQPREFSFCLQGATHKRGDGCPGFLQAMEEQCQEPGLPSPSPSSSWRWQCGKNPVRRN